MVINEQQAKVVRFIYRLFLEGRTPHGIAAILTEQGVPTPTGGHAWQQSTVLSILTNEKYKGDALLQKTFTVDFLTKQHKKNEGELPQYYVKDNHPAIIEPLLFDYVQAELNRRSVFGMTYRGMKCLSSKVVCGDCGSFYGSKTWHSTSTADLVWQCNHRYEQGEKCKTPHLYDQLLRYAFNAAMLNLLGRHSDVLEACKTVLISAVRGRKCKERRAKITKLLDGFTDRQPQAITEDETAWTLLVRQATVKADRTLDFEFINGERFSITLPDYSPRYKDCFTENAP